MPINADSVFFGENDAEQQALEHKQQAPRQFSFNIEADGKQSTWFSVGATRRADPNCSLNFRYGSGIVV